MMHREGDPEPMEDIFTIGEAKMMLTKKEDGTTIPLSEKFNWKTMPKVMLYSRCLSRLCRRLFPDVVFGFYTKEEIEDAVIAPDEGTERVEEVQAEVVDDEVKMPATVEVAAGVEARTFDPQTEKVPAGRPFLNYANSFWSELPKGFLAWLEKNGSGDSKVKAAATREWHEKIGAQETANAVKGDEVFDKALENQRTRRCLRL